MTPQYITTYQEGRYIIYKLHEDGIWREAWAFGGKKKEPKNERKISVDILKALKKAIESELEYSRLNDNSFCYETKRSTAHFLINAIESATEVVEQEREREREALRRQIEGAVKALIGELKK